ncbi:DUF4258 domain-containing protein [Laspinema olomoucense]|uniref:DUF4258 domain-containing protein n=2 Tax=Laspinema TaxID=2584823 RepID=A0ABT2NB97_9CYAN|nr:DUF4258 domain-containing protein [Laspinema sp. D3b]MCT7979976.1 DUF4258 domain-containing protein [Laspinema sp. D3b]
MSSLLMERLTDYQGREVRLTDERLAHILLHPEMANMEKEIAVTLRNPEAVRKSRNDENAWLNYRYYLGTKVGDKWLCVVVKYTEADAFIVTAYLTDKQKKGEQVWP